MSNTALFTEKQRFPAIWIILLGLLFNGIFLYGIYVQVICGHPFGSKPMPNIGLFIGLAVMILFTLLFFSFKLETEIKEDGIYYRFFPIQMKMRKKGWGEISKVYVRQYKPIREFGGWGMRGSFRKGTCVSVSGNKGIQLVLSNNKRLLIGTQKMDEAEKALKQLGKYSAE
jgi:hypothetical protein